MSKITHRDVMQLGASPAQVREFIMDPQRIADYFPSVIDFGTFEAGRAIWCRGKSGISLLELIESECNDSRLTMNVVTSTKAIKPYTIDGIKADPLMTMIEDWEIEASDGGTRLTKTWRNVVMHKMKWLPMGFIIRRTAKAEHGKIVSAWNKAAQ